MVEETCELCGYRSQLGAVEEHRIIPINITEQAGRSKSQTLRMCCNCHRELDTWYSAKVTEMVYDFNIQRFRTKTSVEMDEEYQSVFNGFVTYKKKQKK